VTDSRAAFDFVSGYKPYHVPDSILAQSPLPIERLRREGKILSDRQWLLRIIVLESVAGVPGMVGGTLRHLRSLRLLVRTHLSVLSVERTRLMNREEMGDGSIRYWKKQRMRGCTSCKFPLLDRLYLKERLTSRTFLTVAQPTRLTRLLVLGAQGVMYNLFFFMYLISSKTAHRFVGALEEEACRT
jgi:ubiquinol oxidase